MFLFACLPFNAGIFSGRIQVQLNKELKKEILEKIDKRIL
jgi:hypothetical protein